MPPLNECPGDGVTYMSGICKGCRQCCPERFGDDEPSDLGDEEDLDGEGYPEDWT